MTSLFCLAVLTLAVSGCGKDTDTGLKDATVTVEITYSDTNRSTSEYADINYYVNSSTILSVSSTTGNCTKEYSVPSKNKLTFSCKVKDGYTFDPEKTYSLLFSSTAFITVKTKEGNIIDSQELNFCSEQREGISGEKASYLMKELLSDMAASYNIVVNSDGTLTLYLLDK